MKINSRDFRVRPGGKAKLSECPTIVKLFRKSKEGYQELLAEHVAALSSQQRILYASNRYALLLIFQGMDAAGKDGATNAARDHAGARDALHIADSRENTGPK